MIMMTTSTIDSDEREDQMKRLELREYRVIMTPEMAQEFLTYNTHNRGSKPAQIDTISRALLLGEWKYNGEAVKRDWNGVLLDGQNRLHAIVATGVSAEMLVVEGLEPESQETMDGIVPRRLADILKWRGEKDTNVLAATLNLIHVWNNDGLRNPTSYRPTRGQAITLLEEHPEIRDAIKHGQNVNRNLPLSTTLAAACWYRFSKIDEWDCKDFWTATTTGFHLPVEDESGVLEEHGKHIDPGSGPNLLERYLTREQTRREVSPYVKHGIVVKGWNLYRNGGTGRHHLVFKPNQEKFPEPI